MDVLDLYAKISLDKSEYDKGLDEASNESKSFGSKLAGGLGSAVKTVAKVGAAAVAAGASAAAAITKQAVVNFSEFEQLAGGAKLMFGDAYDFILEKSRDAYKNVQMSQNDYLQQVNGFATGLKTSLGNNEQAAAELADKIITAEADIVAATGNTQENIQNAFNGIMKGNYTMLDNLQIGIKPTKEGMQEVIDKVNEWNASQGNLTKYTINNLADCESAIVDYVAMVGMAGYANDEAAGTIQGSLSMVKAAWDNLLTSFGEGDMGAISKNIDNLVESAMTFAGNVMPVVQRALEGISQLITELAPEIAAALPDMITKVLPSLLDAGVQIIQSLGEGILNAIPELLPTITDVILSLCNMLVQNLPSLIEVGLQVILQLALGIAQALPELIPSVIDTVLTIAEYLIDNVDLLIDASIALIIGLADGLISALPRLIEKAPEIVTKFGDAIIRNAPKILGAAISLILTLIEGIVKCWGKVFEIGAQIIEKIKGGFTSKSAESQKWGRDLIDNFINGIKEKWEHLKQTVKNVAQSVKDFLGFSEPEKGPLSNFHTYAPDMMDLFAKGIRDNENVVTDQIAKSFDFGNITGNVNVSGTATGVSGGFDTVLQRIEALLAQYLPQVQKDIVLDTGALVGGTVAAYDAAFGTRSNRGGLR